MPRVRGAKGRRGLIKFRDQRPAKPAGRTTKESIQNDQARASSRGDFARAHRAFGLLLLRYRPVLQPGQGSVRILEHPTEPRGAARHGADSAGRPLPGSLASLRREHERRGRPRSGRQRRQGRDAFLDRRHDRYRQGDARRGRTVVARERARRSALGRRSGLLAVRGLDACRSWVSRS